MSAASHSVKKSRFSRNLDNPDNPGRLSQFTTLYKTSIKQNPKIPLWMAGGFIVTFVMFELFALLVWHHHTYLGILGMLVGTLVALAIFGQLAKTAAYSSLEGQVGGTSAALQALRRGWYYEQKPVAVDTGRTRKMQELSNTEMVFRAVGKPGVVLIGEGSNGTSRKLLESERKQVTRVVGREVPVHVMRIGTDENTVKIGELTKAMNKLNKQLTETEVRAVNKRLRALGASKPPIPRGMNSRNAPHMNRKAMRGR